MLVPRSARESLLRQAELIIRAGVRFPDPETKEGAGYRLKRAVRGREYTAVAGQAARARRSK